MSSEEDIARLYKVIADNTPEAEDFWTHVQELTLEFELIFSNQGTPERVLTVPMPLPSWAIDAGTD